MHDITPPPQHYSENTRGGEMKTLVTVYIRLSWQNMRRPANLFHPITPLQHNTNSTMHCPSYTKSPRKNQLVIVRKQSRSCAPCHLHKMKDMVALPSMH